MAITLDGLDITKELPKEWAPTMLKKSFQESVVGQLTPAEPMPLNGKHMPVYEGGFEVGYVGEMQRKPVSDVDISMHSYAPNKFAGLIVVSREAARANPGQLLQIMEQDMRNAVARQLDYGIFYGRSALGGTEIPGVTNINATTKRVTLDMDANLSPQIVAGYSIAASGENDPNGFAFDSQMRAPLSLASQDVRDRNGESALLPNLANASTTVAGLKAAYGRTVAGRVGKNAETRVRGFVGDWSKLHWGFSSSIELSRSDQASVVMADGSTVNAFQDNAIIYRLEFEAGWYVPAGAFAAYDAADAAPEE